MRLLNRFRRVEQPRGATLEFLPGYRVITTRENTAGIIRQCLKTHKCSKTRGAWKIPQRQTHTTWCSEEKSSVLWPSCTRQQRQRPQQLNNNNKMAAFKAVFHIWFSGGSDGCLSHTTTHSHGQSEALKPKFTFLSLPISSCSLIPPLPHYTSLRPSEILSSTSTRFSSSVSQQQFHFNCFLSHLIPPRKKTGCEGEREMEGDTHTHTHSDGVFKECIVPSSSPPLFTKKARKCFIFLNALKLYISGWNNSWAWPAASPPAQFLLSVIALPLHQK